ncbi:hypothetical protein ISF_02916 [Cordyceps fumosorosea ARSEF 2679]|uniref:Uncharacterized protein n=1 Tax=Cordyceps fumosorosea (strain ARSEF 2679) TaxID=1081104 RepID=A0A168B5G9_CORFA|nr:hypothetical protein ISF_02916 [Cordyceps fumosorosea ARSEF 2679]OAA69646.1 hypothetical protein ISF_02916 [Cordyceps fumosorosea ARSEF 2679]
MSTFGGVLSEFPEIQIDFFRRIEGRLPPLACFLSHVHSDHLAGLDALRSPFVYCSAATREILLRLERYPCRVNYAKELLEARQQTYKHLGNLLKPIPLETPTRLELAPNLEIQVTLFDANHCPGAVMFLIERDDTAVLYTGDIRSEPWFVNSIARHPALVEYTSGIRTLDKIYLDTSFTDNVPFQTKREGIAELLRKVALYPSDTVFYFQTWTYGYEEVWLALSKALGSKVHVDEYKMRIYTALSGKTGDHRFAALTGYMCGNAWHPGCLTADEGARLHSCEKGNLCAVASEPNVVRIQPIVAHLGDGTDIVEAGVGGGGNDFQRDAVLGSLSPQDVTALQELMKEVGQDDAAFFQSLLQTMTSGRDMPLGLTMDLFGEGLTTSIDKLATMLSRRRNSNPNNTTPLATSLPRVIRFPYARHSSYEELCHLVGTFKPLDVWPCTEDARWWWRNGHSIASYFGEFCSGTDFAYDRMLQVAYPDPPPPPPEEDEDARSTQTSKLASVNISERPSSSSQWRHVGPDDEERPDLPAPKRPRTEADDQEASQRSVASRIMDTDSAVRWDAYTRTLDGLYDGDWGTFPLLSTTDHHSKREEEL